MELYHHGIKGQKWGVRRYQNADGSLTAAGKIRYGYNIDIDKIKRKAIDYTPIKDRPYIQNNIDKWGKTKDTNVLYITGISGSGKSTVADKMGKKNNADIINIDMYTFKTVGKYKNEMSKQFNKYLNENYPNWQTMQKNAYKVLTKTDRRNKKAAGEWFDTLEDAIKKYGSSMHGKQKIIAEGVQILDETLFYKNKKYLKDKPLIIMETSYEDSILSRMVRDNKSLDKLLEPERIEQGKQWLKDQNYLKKMIIGGDKK